MSSQALATRHITLDALRGFAVMGILAMNIVAFALPEWAYVAPGTYGVLFHGVVGGLDFAIVRREHGADYRAG